MKADPGTSYGSATAPFSATETTKTDPLGHHHMPTPYVLRQVGDAFAARDIRVHFDVGDLDMYRTIASRCIPGEGEASCTPIPGIVQYPDFVDDYSSHEADAYLITTGARGGEVVTETACDPGTPSAPKGACHFPDYPGAVPWKLGLQAHRDGPVDATTGNELSDVSTWDGVRRRFDPERRGLFKYLLYAHSRGNPKSLPCLVDGAPAPYLNQGIDTDGPGPDTDTPSCLGMDNPDFDPANYHVPTSASGIAELPGGNLMVTLGFWDEFVGRPFVRAEHDVPRARSHAGAVSRWPGDRAHRRTRRVAAGRRGVGQCRHAHRCRAQLQAELLQFDELSLPGARTVRRQRRDPPRLLVDGARNARRGRIVGWPDRPGPGAADPEISVGMVRPVHQRPGVEPRGTGGEALLQWRAIHHRSTRTWRGCTLRRPTRLSTGMATRADR